ncbi:MAG: hypothetical protein AB4080_09880 [Trichodesmium sp.]
MLFVNFVAIAGVIIRAMLVPLRGSQKSEVFEYFVTGNIFPPSCTTLKKTIYI